jgi:hypothetical protein
MINDKYDKMKYDKMQVSGIADGVWMAWGASGPPYFKQVKRRDALDRMTEVRGGPAAEVVERISIYIYHIYIYINIFAL